MRSPLFALLAGPVVSCALVVGSLVVGSLSQASTLLAQPQPQTLRAQADLDTLPAHRSVTVLVEGEPQTMDMQLYQHSTVPLVTYYPATMTVEQACDIDGCGVSFTDEATGAGVIVLFPAGATQAVEVAPYVTGPEGVMAENGWVVTGSYDGQLEFPWARQLVTFQPPDRETMGLVYLGEASGHGFAAIAVFPPEAGDGFMPQVNAMFGEVRVKP
jgi:hypothetical protein